MFYEKLFPFSRYEVSTTADQSDVLRQIRFAFHDEDRYTVQTDEDAFIVKEKMTRYSGMWRYNNSYAPIAKGTFRVDAGKRILSVSIRPRLVSMIIVCAFIAIGLLCFVLGVVGVGTDIIATVQGEESEGVIPLLAIFPALWIAQYFFFKRPAKRMCEMIDQAMAEAERNN